MNFDPATNPLNAHEWIFPFLEVIHISCFALSIGLISVVNLRLAGATFAETTAQELNRRLFLWTLAGLTLVITAGMLLFTTDPLRYFYNRSFRFKMYALLTALIYQYTIHSYVMRRQRDGTGPAILSAFVCTVLWVSVSFGGIFYAFTY